MAGDEAIPFAQMAQRFGQSPARYLEIRDPVLALAIDDALHQRLVRFESSGHENRPPPDQQFATDSDFDDADWIPPDPPAGLTPDD